MNFNFLFTKWDIQEWGRARFVPRGLVGLPTNPIFDLKEQQEVIAYIEKNLSADDRIYYWGYFVCAEISHIVDRVFYPLDRYFYMREWHPLTYRQHNSYLILDSYLHGIYPWRYTATDFSYNVYLKLCDRVEFTNDSYFLCRLRS
ncbi:MAG: hypothetical protein HQK53_10535 [Oligoflexia bacterium]|nr:hypothetical protein [Oligoflexia bacterium]